MLRFFNTTRFHILNAILFVLLTYLRATAAGFSKLSERISHLEDALLLQHQMQGGGGAGPGDQNLPPEDEEEEEEAEYERR